MLSVLNKLFGWGGSKGESPQSGRLLPLKDMDEEDIPRYPPLPKACLWPRLTRYWRLKLN